MIKIGADRVSIPFGHWAVKEPKLHFCSSAMNKRPAEKSLGQLIIHPFIQSPYGRRTGGWAKTTTSKWMFWTTNGAFHFKCLLWVLTICDMISLITSPINSPWWWLYAKHVARRTCTIRACNPIIFKFYLHCHESQMVGLNLALATPCQL